MEVRCGDVAAASAGGAGTAVRLLVLHTRVADLAESRLVAEIWYGCAHDDDLLARGLSLAAGRECSVCNRPFVSVRPTETRGGLQELY